MKSEAPSARVKTEHAAAEVARTFVPPLLVIVLAFPCFRFSYLYDDFNFVLRAWSFDLRQLLPDPTLAFYRPLSREIYFALLTAIDRVDPLWGHIGNAICLAASVAVLADLTRLLAGPRAGFVAGVLYASLSPLPFLVGFVSCSQDVLAGLFLLVGLRLELAGKSWLAAGACAAALLSKETALLVVPVVAALPWLLKRDRSRLRGNILRYGLLVVAWCAVHPKIQSILRGSIVTGEGGYMGLDNPKAWINTVSMTATMLNLPSTGMRTPWPAVLNEVFAVGLVLTALGYWVLPKRARDDWVSEFPRARVITVGLLLLLLPGIPTAALVKHWAAYYACIPAIGAAVVSSVALAGMDRRAIIGVLAAFLVLGTWSRGMGEGRRFGITESNFRGVSNQLLRIEDGMKRLRPTLAENTRLYVTVQTKDRRVEGHFFSFQAPRVWYQDPTITTQELEEFRPEPERLVVFWVDKDANIFELEYPSLEPRSAGLPIQYADYQKARRSLALGLARAGRVDEAARAILTMRAMSRVQWAFDRRLAAALFIRAGRPEDAVRMASGLPPMDRTEALYALAAALGVYEPPENFDLAAFAAFGVQADDVEAWRYLMHWYVSNDQIDAAHRMAVRLQSLSPSDEEAGLVIKAMLEKPRWEPIIPPVTR